jgi:predicted Rossmann-fold nucleotide-binding protein
VAARELLQRRALVRAGGFQGVMEAIATSASR